MRPRACTFSKISADIVMRTAPCTLIEPYSGETACQSLGSCMAICAVRLASAV